MGVKRKPGRKARWWTKRRPPTKAEAAAEKRAEFMRAVLHGYEPTEAEWAEFHPELKAEVK